MDERVGRCMGRQYAKSCCILTTPSSVKMIGHCCNEIEQTPTGCCLSSANQSLREGARTECLMWAVGLVMRGMRWWCAVLVHVVCVQSLCVSNHTDVDCISLSGDDCLLPCIWIGSHPPPSPQRSETGSKNGLNGSLGW